MAHGPTQATLCDLDIPNEDYYAAVNQYLDNYLWHIGDHPPTSEAKLWQMFEGGAAKYAQSIKIRESATSTGKELKRNPNRKQREENAPP